MISLARDILRVVFRHRRGRAACPACAAAAARVCDGCMRPHLARVARYVVAGAPIHFALPAFPAKSPNPRKVLGARADMAEEIGLRHLQSMGDEIACAYAPGARITICSDGHVFADLVGVADADVMAYAADVRSIIETLGLRSLDAFSLADVFPDGSFEDQRTRLVAGFAEPLDRVRARLHQTAHGRALYNGIHRFLFEDAVTRATGSRNRIRRETGERTYEVIQRSQAWGRAVSRFFPDAVRLSIHPQPAGAFKIGIRLGAAEDAWLTPWHAVALEAAGRFRLVHRADAEAMGATLIERVGRASHYLLSSTLEKSIPDHHLEVA